MNQIQALNQALNQHLQKAFSLDASALQACALSLNVDEQKQAFGDLSSNAGMILAKLAGQNPRSVAQKIVDSFSHPAVAKIEIAGPGFLNFFLTPAAYESLAQELFLQQTDFFKPLNLAQEKINIEFVSANPTGPLHVGHGRGGIIGDVLARVLSFVGHNVTKEFYINDAGAQITKLGTSLKTRYQQANGIDIDMPEDSYHGDYIVDLAQTLHAQHGAQWIDKSVEFFGDYAKKLLLEKIKETLANYGITFDVWFSEKTLHTSGAIDAALKELDERGYLYTNENAVWFSSTKFGDDKDRVVKKSDGELTYIAADIAYLQNKINRGFNHLIMTLGHDHHSYEMRLLGIQKALGLSQYPLDIIFFQLVKLKEGEEYLKMSKRAGTIVTLDDLIKTVGKDVARYFYLNRKADAQLDFDLGLALTQSDENPVYYIQYAYVRTGSILEKAAAEKALENITAADLKNLSADDALLLKKISSLQSMLETIATSHQTHLLAYYTHELAQVFNRYYNKNRVIDPENIAQSRARLALILIARNTLALCLDLLGLSKPERM